MKKIVNKKTNQINYGIHDYALDYNWFDYQLRNFWDKKFSITRSKHRFHQFHFVCFTTSKYVIGLAFVDLAIAKNIFGYVFEKDKGLIVQWQKSLLPNQMTFTSNYDNHLIERCTKNNNIHITTNIFKGYIKGDFRYKRLIDLQYEIPMEFKQKPLRVINPADFDRWTYTEKRAGLVLKKIEVKLNNQVIDINENNALASIDYSGGFFKRNTNWLWANGSVKVNQEAIGFNFAVFNNDALFNENAIWINNEREHYKNILFKWNYQKPYEQIEIYTDDKKVHLYFNALSQKSDVHSRGLGLVKTNFHQYIGIYKGYVTVNGRKIDLPPFLGLIEMHKSLW